MGRNSIRGGGRHHAQMLADEKRKNDAVAGYMRNGKFVGNSKLHGDYERRMRDEARAGFPLGFVARVIGGRIARVGMKGVATSVAKTAAKAAATHALQRQVEKAMDSSEATAGRWQDDPKFDWHTGYKEQLKKDNVYGGQPGHAYAGVIPLDMRIG